MSREIKFRAWGTAVKKMVSWETIMLHDSLNLAEYFTNPDSDIVLMQYTGLKDKNGAEIYEGDIVPLSNGVVTKNAYVEFFKGCFCIAGRDPETDEMLYSPLYELVELGDGHGVEVIGNVYENPELLNQKKEDK